MGDVVVLKDCCQSANIKNGYQDQLNYSEEESNKLSNSERDIPGAEKKPTVLIDGFSVAMSHGFYQSFSCRGIEVAVQYFVSRGYPKVVAILNENDTSLPYINESIIEKLRRDGHLVFVESDVSSAILQRAKVDDALIVSNKQFKRLSREDETCKRICEKCLVPFLFPEPDCLNVGPHPSWKVSSMEKKPAWIIEDFKGFTSCQDSDENDEEETDTEWESELIATMKRHNDQLDHSKEGKPTSNKLSHNSERDVPAAEKKPTVLIDGFSVAVSHGCYQSFSCRGIEVAVQYFVSRGYKVLVFLFEHDNSLPYVNENILEKLRADGHLVYLKDEDKKDASLILSAAEEFDALVISNNNFEDLWCEDEGWKAVCEKYLLPFTFGEGDLFYPGPYPSSRVGSLEKWPALQIEDFVRAKQFDETEPEGSRDDF